MTAIPADIQNSAERVYAQLGRGPDADEQAIAKALMAERERAARDADAVIDQDGIMSFIQSSGWIGLREAVAASIRSPQPSPPAGAERP
jgi:hypothetical protein